MLNTLLAFKTQKLHSWIVVIKNTSFVWSIFVLNKIWKLSEAFFPSDHFKVLNFDPDICASLLGYLVRCLFDPYLHWNTNMAKAVVNSFAKTAKKVNLLHMEWKWRKGLIAKTNQILEL